MPKFKITYDHGVSTHEEIIEADSLEEAKELADLHSVYRYFTVKEIDNTRLEEG